MAKDVCDTLGIVNVGNALARLLESEKNTITISDGNRGNPNKAIIRESGLYKLLFYSRKPEAEAFQDWVTQEVAAPKLQENAFTGIHSYHLEPCCLCIICCVPPFPSLER